VRILTLNTWKNDGNYERRLPLMRDGLAALSPDVVCLQECFACDQVDTAAWLAFELGYTLHAAPARWKPRRHGAGEVESCSGLAVLARERGGASQLTLSSHPADGERIAQAVDLQAGGRPLRILNLHLTHLRGPGADLLRDRQLTEALAWAERGLQGGLIVAGDLNATSASAELAPLGLEPRPATLQGARAGAVPLARDAIDHCVLLRPGAWRSAGLLRGLDTPDEDGWFPSDHAAVGVALVPAE
jgi:endonuclease/exonuclease/phosphatase family metal-dependent hydrolase